MSNTRILYHGTTMENAITMLGSNFSSIVDETVWNCSDDDMLYMAEKTMMAKKTKASVSRQRQHR